MSITTPIEAENRIQLPAEWLEELRLRGKVLLERTPQGILVRPAPLTWDEIFAHKLTINQVPVSEECEVTRDDLLF